MNKKYLSIRLLSTLILIVLIMIKCSSPKLMKYSEFSAQNKIELPKILTLDSKDKKLLYFGTYHSNNLNDSLFALIKNEFKKFDPDYILYEGKNWPIYKNSDSTILISGEPGFLISLCNERGIEKQSIEPREEEEYKFLLKKHNLNWVVLMYLCRQINQQQRFIASHHTTDEQFYKNISYFLENLKLKGIPLEKTQMNYAYWKSKYKELLRKELDWRTFNPSEYYPNFNLTQMNEINRTSDSFRNQHMIQSVLDSFTNHKKVMVLVGGGHLIVQEKLLKYKFYKR